MMGNGNNIVSSSLESDDLPIINIPCGAWCFLLGLAGVNAGEGRSSVVGCVLPKGHNGEHKTTVESFANPKAKFTITWELG